MKVCCRCKVEKLTEDFRWKNKAKGWLQPYCIQCNKQYNKEHYVANKATYLKKAKSYDDIARGRNRELLWKYFSDNPCIDCGEKDPIVLEFDHKDTLSKEINVSAMMKSYSWERIQQEVAKCDVRCGNCHKRRTANQFGWWRAFRKTN